MTSPLNANAISSLLQNIGLTINPVSAGYSGASVDNSVYVPGSIITSTCLNDLTNAINLAYAVNQAPGTKISNATYNNLISIGSTTIPALGNSKPPTYIVSDPSNEWTGQATTGFAISGNTGQGQSATWIPYTLTNPNHSVTQWGYLRLHALQAWNEFNWNGDNTNTTTVTAGSFVNGVLYTILNVGSTDFTLIGASSNTIGVSFIATGSGTGNGTATYIGVDYKDFLSSFMTVDSFINYINPTINSLVNGTTFLDGIYSNMNDLITGDVTGVTLATKQFGQDCITLGKAIDLSQIQKFGLPSVLLQTIKKYNGITQSLSLALLSSGLSVNEIESILKGNTTTVQQEQQIYGAFLIIVGQNLVDILVTLNCKTLGLESLADLLDVKKIFPNSYQSLTVPLYNITPLSTNSKTYYLIYDGTNVSASIDTPSIKQQVGTIVIPAAPAITQNTTNNIQELPTGYGSYLNDILPNNIALAAGAFTYSMQQIKNIQFVDFEKFSQVVFNIESTKDLTLINGTNIPANDTLLNQGIDLIALGSGPNKTYTTSDFFGCMSGLPYDWRRLEQLILKTQTTTLSTIYTDLYNAIVADGPGLDATVQGYVDAANAEILSIYNTNTKDVQELISLYEQFGSQLLIEQRARYIALAPVPIPRDIRLNSYPSTIITFADSLSQYSSNTLPHMQAQTIEAISNLNIIGGQSISGAMREYRNSSRLNLIGVPLDNTIPPILDDENEQNLCCNGVTSYTINGTTYDTIPSTLEQEIGNVIYTPEPAGKLLPTGSPLPNQNVNPYNTDMPIIQSIQSPVYVSNDDIPLDTGQAMYPGSFAGSPFMNLVPCTLNTTYASGHSLPSTYNVSEAINQVIHCNCDCWLT